MVKNRISEIKIFPGRHNNSLDTAEASVSEFQSKDINYINGNIEKRKTLEG